MALSNEASIGIALLLALCLILRRVTLRGRIWDRGCA